MSEVEQRCPGAPELSVVIVNYNGAEFIGQCLESVINQCGPSAEIVVLDNASTDESIEVLRRQSLPLKLIVSDVNLGFARGVNRAVNATSGSILLLINPDAQLCGSIRPALEQLKSSANIGVLGLSISYPDGKPQTSYGFDHTPFRILSSWAGFDRVPVVGHLFALHERRFRRYARARDVEWVSGACLLVRKSTWLRVGGFDERYFMYVEDADLCKCVRSLGERVCYTSAVRVCHSEGGSVKGFNESAMIRTARSYLGYCKKWRGEFSSEVVRVGLAAIFMGRWLLLLLVNAGTLGTMANVSARVSAQRRVAMALLFRRWYAE